MFVKWAQLAFFLGSVDISTEPDLQNSEIRNNG